MIILGRNKPHIEWMSISRKWVCSKGCVMGLGRSPLEAYMDYAKVLRKSVEGVLDD